MVSRHCGPNIGRHWRNVLQILRHNIVGQKCLGLEPEWILSGVGVQPVIFWPPIKLSFCTMRLAITTLTGGNTRPRVPPLDASGVSPLDPPVDISQFSHWFEVFRCLVHTHTYTIYTVRSSLRVSCRCLSQTEPNKSDFTFTLPKTSARLQPLVHWIYINIHEGSKSWLAASSRFPAVSPMLPFKRVIRPTLMNL